MALRWLGKIVLEDFDTVIGNMKNFSSSNTELLQWPVFNKFLVTEDGLPLRFIVLDKPISALLALNGSTAFAPEDIATDHVEDQYSSESSSARMRAQRRRPGNPFDLSASAKRKQKS